MRRSPRRVKLVATLKLTLVLGVSIVCAWLASGLELHTSYAQLVSPSSPVLRGRLDVLAQTQSTTELIIAIDGPAAQRRALAAALTPALLKLPELAQVVDTWPVAFFQERALYLLPLDDLDELEQTLLRTAKRLKAQTNPLFVSLKADDDPWEPLSQQLKRLKLKHRPWPKGALSRSPQGHLEDGQTLYLVLRPRGVIGDMAQTEATLKAIHATIARLHTQPSLSVALVGRMVTTQEEHETLEADMARATAWALALILCCVLLMTRRAQAPLLFVAPLMVGLVVTLALTRLIFGQLNLVSGFMLPILAGLGVDFCVHLYMDYLAQLRRGLEPEAAKKAAVSALWRPSLVGALTSAAAFGALGISDFKGVKEYGLIASYGLIIMWAATFVVLPSLLELVPSRSPGPESAPRLKAPKQETLKRLLLLGACLSALAMSQSYKVEFKNDFIKLRGDSPSSRAYLELGQRLQSGLDPTIWLVEDQAQAERLLTEIEHARQRQRRLTPEAPTNFGVALGLPTFLPRAPKETAASLERMRHALEPAWRRRDALPDQDRAQLEQVWRMVNARPWDHTQLPPIIRTRFLAQDGRAQLVLLFKRAELEHDHDYLEWTMRQEALMERFGPSKRSPSSFDEVSVTTQVIRSLKDDLRWMLGAASLATLLILGVSFRDVRQTLWAAGALAAGLVVTLGVMASLGLSFNLFNAVIIPSIVGIGIDNAVHIVHGAHTQGILQTLQVRWAPILLSSLTTMIGFGAMICAHHHGIYTLGQLAILGILCTFGLTSVGLPAWLLYRDAKR